jgi:aryl-alcohol dehydrogenase-like predicted oxidoreductase
MRTITLPGTELITSRLGFGTAALHHLFNPRDRQRLLLAALDAGFTHFDTARMYGEGMAERSLGALLAGGMRRRVTLATKFGIRAQPWQERFPPLLYAQRALSGVARRAVWKEPLQQGRCWSATAAAASLTASLRSLRTDWVDMLLVHEPRDEDLPALQALAPWLQQQQTSGRVRYLGLAGQAATCLSIHQAMPGVFQVLQVEDSRAGQEADALTTAGLPLQVTYGYVRRAGEPSADDPQPDTLALLRSAIARNPGGMVLVSTRKRERIQALAGLADQETQR